MVKAILSRVKWSLVDDFWSVGKLSLVKGLQRTSPLEDCDAVVKDLQRHSPPRGGTLRSMIKWCRIKDLWLRACSFTGLQERYASVDGMHRTSPGGM